MKLLNYTSAYFAAILLIIITIWAGVFYYAMLDEIYDSIDDGLDNQKGLIIQKAATDSSVLTKNDFEESDYAIREIPAAGAIIMEDIYIDTLMFMQNENSNEPVRLLKTVFLQNNKYYQLHVATSMVEEDDLIKQLFYSILWLYFGLVITILLFNNYLLKRIWKPFYQVVKQLKIFRLDQPMVVEPVPTNVDEFRILNDAVQKLLKRNVDIYKSQKNFIENASHELQTPLAISINKLETLAEQSDLPPDHLQLLASAMDNLERLTRLNKSLLLLSNIDNKKYEVETSVNFNALVKAITSDFTDQSVYSDIKITIVEKSECRQRMNADLAAILITNLIKNAIIHNVSGGFVIITLEEHSLLIENSGQADPLDPAKIFSRFYTGKPSASSSGLGLAIVHAILQLYRFETFYTHNKHHEIVIKFP